jgi:hypothetical protein
MGRAFAVIPELTYLEKPRGGNGPIFLGSIGFKEAFKRVFFCRLVARVGGQRGMTL